MKQALIDRLRADYGMTTADATTAVDQVFAASRRVIESSERLAIPGFGIFRRKLRDTRQVRNPRTGELSTKLAHHVITFKESKPPKGGS